MYGYHGSMWTVPGRRDEVVEILTSGAGELLAAGCRSYVVGVTDEDPDEIVVTEVWLSREHHDASLRLPSVQEQIARARPMLAGRFASRELRIVGGLGVDVDEPVVDEPVVDPAPER
ncbi:putative quinol monooxygenase [Actinotalea solisilvae]|uniref:putative quinol monooxygenase n=1 Tax=Actinotalea solisilvae TaxID=2072922 RepID=UPI0018F1D1FA|nr:antibiotic biosynthesis monooxygenase [Actinotalea solisilvae]